MDKKYVLFKKALKEKPSNKSPSTPATKIIFIAYINIEDVRYPVFTKSGCLVFNVSIVITIWNDIVTPNKNIKYVAVSIPPKKILFIR